MEKVQNTTDLYVVLLKKTRTEAGIRKLLDKFFLDRMKEVEAELIEIAAHKAISRKVQ